MKKAKLKIEELPVEALRPYENNARQHGDKGEAAGGVMKQDAFRQGKGGRA